MAVARQLVQPWGTSGTFATAGQASRATAAIIMRKRIGLLALAALTCVGAVRAWAAEPTDDDVRRAIERG